MNGVLGNTNDTGVVRLSENGDSSGQGALAEFDTDPSSVTPGGCPTSYGGTSAPSEPYSALDFILDTGSDDLDPNSELDIDIINYAGATIEHGVLHPKGGEHLDNNTEFLLEYDVNNPSISYTDIASIKMTIIPATIFLGSTDEWHAQAIEVFAVNGASPWDNTCLFLGQQADSSTAEFNFNESNPAQVLSTGNGCL